MIRWVFAIFVLISVFYPLLPFLGRLGIGRLPGDVRFQWRGVLFCLPFGSTLLWSAIAFVLAKLARLA
jgi:hypothetical protein